MAQASAQPLPDGLELTPEGRLQGLVSSDVLETGEAERTFAFLVEVRDGQNGTSVEALAIRVLREAPQPPAPAAPASDGGGGCSTTAGGSSLLALALVASVLRSRRRS